LQPLNFIFYQMDDGLSLNYSHIVATLQKQFTI